MNAGRGRGGVRPSDAPAQRQQRSLHTESPPSLSLPATKDHEPCSVARVDVNAEPRALARVDETVGGAVDAVETTCGTDAPHLHAEAAVAGAAAHVAALRTCWDSIRDSSPGERPRMNWAGR